MSRIVVVEPNPGGHRFQWVEWVARVALQRGDEVTLLTQHGARDSEQFQHFLGALPLRVVESFDDPDPPVAAMGEAIAELHRAGGIDAYVILDSDRMLKQWWRVAPRALRARGGRPEAIIVMSRFPPRPAPWELRLVAERLAKSTVALLAKVTGAGDRFLYVAPRNARRPGLLFKRLRDPAICTAHSHDRLALRERLGLPSDRRLMGVIGSLAMRKNPDLVLGGARMVGPDVDLVLAGVVLDDVAAWLDTLSPEERNRIHERPGFLTDADIDAYVAACDVIVVAHSNPGPSGLMGKAQAAGVPVLSAGSSVRRREAAELGVGVHTELTAEGLAGGMRRLLTVADQTPAEALDLPTAEEFGARVLGAPYPSLGSETAPARRDGAGAR